jgi:NitT/TauT family transport system permease protein
MIGTPAQVAAPQVAAPNRPTVQDVRRSLITALSRLIKPAIVIVLLVLAWDLYTVVGHVSALVLPRPGAVWSQLVDHPGLFWRNGLATLTIVIVGFTISLVAGVTAAVLMTRYRFLQETFLPLAVASQVIPIIAIAPLLVIWLGFGAAPRIAVASLISFFPILINTVAGLKQVEEPYYDLAASFGASRNDRFRKIEFPHALPFIFAGAKLAVTLAVIGTVIGEFVNASSGLGFLILQGSSQLRTDLMLAALVCLCVMGLILFNLVRLVEYLALPWERRQR